MRKLKLLLALAALTATLSATAQLRFGVKVGADFNSIDATNLDCQELNSTAFTGGIMAEYNIPLIGIGVDASLLYTRPSVPRAVYFLPADGDIMVGAYTTRKDFLDVPVNIKYTLSMPMINKVVKPYVATGPSLSVRLSEKAKDDAIELKKTYLSWSLGAGVELIERIQIGFCYRWALGGLNETDLSFTTRHYDLKNNGWRVTAAYLF